MEILSGSRGQNFTATAISKLPLRSRRAVVRRGVALKSVFLPRSVPPQTPRHAHARDDDELRYIRAESLSVTTQTSTARAHPQAHMHNVTSSSLSYELCTESSCRSSLHACIDARVCRLTRPPIHLSVSGRPVTSRWARHPTPGAWGPCPAPGAPIPWPPPPPASGRAP